MRVAGDKDGEGGKGNGNGNKGGGQETATATQRAMAMAMRVVGNKEGKAINKALVGKYVGTLFPRDKGIGSG
jgi:hypothetical protein